MSTSFGWSLVTWPHLPAREAGWGGLVRARDEEVEGTREAHRALNRKGGGRRGARGIQWTSSR
jgi:hypothetical protein